MKSIRVFGALLCSGVFSMSVLAQSMEAIEPVTLPVSDALTTSLLFPYAIKKASWCSPHFAVQQTKEVNNLLEIKWTSPGHGASNLSVVTSDGQFYSFLIVYDTHPPDLSFRFNKTPRSPVVQFSNMPLNEQQLQVIADSIYGRPAHMHRGYRGDILKGELQGIYTSEGITWFKVRLKNRQRSPLAIHHMALAVRDKSRVKSGIAQHKMIGLIYSSGPVVLQQQKQTMITGFPATVWSKRKRLHLVLQNERGVQLLKCKLPYRLLLKAQPISYAEN